jgi:hypothetical protein
LTALLEVKRKAVPAKEGIIKLIKKRNKEAFSPAAALSPSLVIK